MAVFKRGEVWWYKFYFAGRLFRESSKSTSKTVAKAAEQQRRRELEAGFHTGAFSGSHRRSEKVAQHQSGQQGRLGDTGARRHNS
jgi:hypothetical protein